MKTLLLYPSDNLETVLGRGKVFVEASEPHNLLSLAAYIRERGFSQVRILDSYAMDLGHDDIMDYIEEYDPQVVGLTCYTSDAPMTIQLCRRINEKYPDKALILGGTHPTFFCDEFLHNGGVDFIVVSEGEETLYELLTVLRDGGSFHDIKGLIFKENGQTIRTQTRDQIQDLNSLPKAAWDLAPMHLYKLPFYFHPRGNRSLITSRGCPVGCTFCAVHNGKKIRYQSAERMVQDYHELVDKYDAKHIHFMDSLFVGNKQRIMEFCDRVLSEKKRVSWSCSAYTNCMSYEMLQKMKQAGCSTISYGLESGNKEMLDNVKKNQSLEKVREVVKWTKEVGIKARGLFMIGMPGETEEQTLKTIQFAKELPLDGAQFSITTPYPGTELYDDLVRENKIDKMAWERYSAYSTFSDVDPIWIQEGMTAEKLKKLQKKAILDFYLRPRLIFSEMKKLRMGNIKRYFGGFKAITSLIVKDSKVDVVKSGFHDLQGI